MSESAAEAGPAKARTNGRAASKGSRCMGAKERGSFRNRFQILASLGPFVPSWPLEARAIAEIQRKIISAHTPSDAGVAARRRAAVSREASEHAKLQRRCRSRSAQVTSGIASLDFGA